MAHPLPVFDKILKRNQIFIWIWLSQSYICCQTFSEEHYVGTKSMYFIYQRFADVQKQKTSKLCQSEGNITLDVSTFRKVQWA